MSFLNITSKYKLTTGDTYSTRFMIGNRITDYKFLLKETRGVMGDGILYQLNSPENVMVVYHQRFKRPMSIRYLRRYSFSTVAQWLRQGLLYEMIPIEGPVKNRKYFETPVMRVHGFPMQLTQPSQSLNISNASN